METTFIQGVKLSIVAVTGLSKDALHIYVGLAVFLAAAAVSGRPLRSWLPWLVVLGVTLTGEFVDMVDDIQFSGRWKWTASVHDVWNTMAWPTVLALLARYTAVLKR